MVASNSLLPGEIKIPRARVLSKNYIPSIRCAHVRFGRQRTSSCCLAVATGEQACLDVGLSAAAFPLVDAKDKVRIPTVIMAQIQHGTEVQQAKYNLLSDTMSLALTKCG